MCIGCKACEVACKEWNGLPDPEADMLKLTGMSYDNTGALGANSWRHVAFIEDTVPVPYPGALAPQDGGDLLSAVADADGDGEGGATRWLMASDVCKHCTHAACLDVCPTGALVRTEFGTVIVQPDVCNGCAYCVSACPFGVIDRREDDGRAWKCTMCYDRLRGDLEPACATACPTDSIQFGPLDELRAIAQTRLEEVAVGRHRRPGSTARTRRTASAAAARSSCCWTSPRSTACRRTRWSPPGTCPPCGAGPAWPPPRWPSAWPWPSPGGGR